MVMLAEPLALAVEAARAAQQADGIDATRVLGMAADGAPLTDGRVKGWAATAGTPGQALGLILVCGRYEGIDQRFIEACVEEEVSIGDFVLSGGEVPAMALIDAVVRALPGALKEASVADESFAEGELGAPQYTRPEVWRGRAVPQVLLSGHHAQIEAWRRAQARERTAQRRPDLLARMAGGGVVRS
jgi:tRNA (guanine37-N1)-methyltransferase